jgi:hypothetical protein
VHFNLTNLINAMILSQLSLFFRDLLRYLLSVIVFSTAVASACAQVYRPFDFHAVALYTTSPVAGATTSLAFTDSALMEGDSIFFPYYRADIADDNAAIQAFEYCEDVDFWGSGGACSLQNVPLWFGRQIRKTGPETYTCETTQGDTLFFDFGLAVDDSSTVFQDTDQSLLLIAEGEGAINQLEVEDAVYQYRLAHLDAQGIPMETALHNAPITIGDQLGAIHFMRIDSFPVIAQPITIAGHSGAEAGLYEIKAVDVYDRAIGDVYQYRYYSLSNPFDPAAISYRTYTVTDRSEDQDSVWYAYDVHHFTPDSVINTLTEQVGSVSKTEVLVSFPFESDESIHPDIGLYELTYYIQSLVFTPEACMSEYTYKIESTYFMNCPQGGVNCYGNSLHVAPGDFYSLPREHELKQGLGRTYRSSGNTICCGGGMVSGSNTKLVYSQKGGVECGDLLVLDTEEVDALGSELKVFPNPTTDVLHIGYPTEAIEGNLNLEVYDSSGRRMVFQNNIIVTEGNLRISTEGWDSGVYFFRMLDEAARKGSGKFVVIR